MKREVIVQQKAELLQREKMKFKKSQNKCLLKKTDFKSVYYNGMIIRSSDNGNYMGTE